VEADLDEELRSYVDLAIDEKQRSGLIARDARRAVRVEVGSIDSVKEGVRDARAGAWLDQLRQDLLYGLRMLRKNAGFTLVAVGSLALGIGATTAVYSLIDALVLHPFPIADSGRLMRLRDHSDDPNFDHWGFVRWSDLAVYRAESRGVLSELTAYQSGLGRPFSVNARDEREAFEAEVAPVSGNYFSTLGVRPALGRLLSPGDDTEQSPTAVAVLSHSCWARRFARDPAVLGRELVLNGTPFTLIGVAPETFRGLDLQLNPDVFVPATMGEAVNPRRDTRRPPRSPYSFSPTLVGRLRDDVSVGQAEAVLSSIARRIAHASGRRTTMSMSLQPVAAAAVGSEAEAMRQFTLMLLAVAGACLLIACANVAGLLLARSVERRNEIGLRLALGASKGRIVRQLITEGAVLAALAGAAGLPMAAAMFRVLGAFRLPGFVWVHTLGLGLDGRVLATTTGVSLLACLLFSLAPACQAGRLDLRTAITSTGERSGRRPMPVRGLLLIGQVALCLPLLVGAGLLLRTLHKAMTVNLGFEPQGLVTLEFPGLPPERASSVIESLAERSRHWPGVEAASSAASCCGYHASTLYVDGTAREIGSDKSINAVDTDYFRAMGIPVVRGRALGREDAAKAPKVAVVSESFARRLWPGQDPVGRRFGCRSLCPWSERRAATETLEVVGVVRDARYNRLRESDGAVRFYVPLPQLPADLHQLQRETLVVRSRGAEAAMALVKEARAIDPTLPPPEIRHWSDIAYSQLMTQRVGALLLVLFGAVALGLSAVGLYGLVAYAVGQRRAEIGVRVALGASRGDVVELVLRQGTTLLGTGLIVGLLLSAWATRLLERFVFGIPSGDPNTLGGATLVLAAVGLLACYVPARRAARVDPMVALRAE
jgi:predicted permease